MKMAESSLNGLKTLWEKKLFVTRNFSFSHSVFKRLILQPRKNQGLFGKGLTNRDEADPLFSKKSRHGTQPHSTMSRNKLCTSAEWFDSDCYNARQLYLRALNKFNFNKTRNQA